MSDLQERVTDRLEPLVLPPEGWTEVQGTVISSAWHRAKLRDLGEDLPGDRSYFVICFNYNAAGTRYDDRFDWHNALEPGRKIFLHFNPAKPNENSLSLGPSKGGSRLIALALGVVAAAVLLYLQERFGWS